MQEITFQQNSFFKEEILIFKHQPTGIYGIINKTLKKKIMPVTLIFIDLFWVKNYFLTIAMTDWGTIMCTCLFYLMEVKIKVLVSEELNTNETANGRIKSSEESDKQVCHSFTVFATGKMSHLINFAFQLFFFSVNFGSSPSQESQPYSTQSIPANLQILGLIGLVQAHF